MVFPGCYFRVYFDSKFIEKIVVTNYMLFCLHLYYWIAVIVAATNGDEAAIQEILDFYDGYISKLSLRKLYDEYGNVYMVVDSELKGRIQAAVMDMIANFEIVVI